jgi:hypothetical protein
MLALRIVVVRVGMDGIVIAALVEDWNGLTFVDQSVVDLVLVIHCDHYGQFQSSLWLRLILIMIETVTVGTDHSTIYHHTHASCLVIHFVMVMLVVVVVGTAIVVGLDCDYYREYCCAIVISVMRLYLFHMTTGLD